MTCGWAIRLTETVLFLSHVWESEGHGDYSLAPDEGVARGTKIVIELKEGEEKFADAEELKSIVKRYSNFVGFPIILEGRFVAQLGSCVVLLACQRTSEVRELGSCSFIYRPRGNTEHHSAVVDPTSLSGRSVRRSYAYDMRGWIAGLVVEHTA